MKYPLMFRRQENYKYNSKVKLPKGCILLFAKKGEIGITNNFGDITQTARVNKVYSDLLLNRTQTEIEKRLEKNQDGFRRIRSTMSQILTICRIKCVKAKNLEKRDAYDKFPDIFAQAFKIDVDSWKFSMLLLFILWDD